MSIAAPNSLQAVFMGMSMFAVFDSDDIIRTINVTICCSAAQRLYHANNFRFLGHVLFMCAHIQFVNHSKRRGVNWLHSAIQV